MELEITRTSKGLLRERSDLPRHTYHIYLLLTEFDSLTASYGPRFEGGKGFMRDA